MLQQLKQNHPKNVRKVIFIESTDIVKPGIYTSSGELSQLKQSYNIIKIFNKNLLSDELKTMLDDSSLSQRSLLNLFEESIIWGVGIENETIIYSDKKYNGSSLLKLQREIMPEKAQVYSNALVRPLIQTDKTYIVYNVKQSTDADTSGFGFGRRSIWFENNSETSQLMTQYMKDFQLSKSIKDSIVVESTVMFDNFEFITPYENDFYKKKTINIYINEIIQKKNIYLKYLNAKKKPPILKYPKIGGHILYNNKNNTIAVDYTGSYHLNLSLPYNEVLLNQEERLYNDLKLELLDNPHMIMSMIKINYYTKIYDKIDNTLNMLKRNEVFEQEYISRQMWRQYEKLRNILKNPNIIKLYPTAYNIIQSTMSELGNTAKLIFNKIKTLNKDILNTKYVEEMSHLLKNIDTCNNALTVYNKKLKYSNGFHKLTKIWAICIQWILPLILSCYSSANPLSIGDDNKFSELTLRSFISGYSFINITDIYSTDIPDGREINNNIDKDLKERLAISYPYFKLDKSSDVHTEFRADPSKGFNFGFELRVFDYFDPKHLDTLLELLFLLADHMDEQNITLDSINNPVGNTNLNAAVIQICMHGWLTPINNDYKQLLIINLSLPPDIFNFTNTAYDVINKLYNYLQGKFIKNGRSTGIYSQFLIKDDPDRVIKNLPNINRYSWDCAFENLIWQKNKDITAAIISTYDKSFSDNSKNIFMDGDWFDNNLKTNFSKPLKLPKYEEDCINIRYFMERYAVTMDSDKLRSAEVTLNNNRLQQAKEIAKEIAKENPDTKFSTLKEHTLSADEDKLYSKIDRLLYNAVM